MLKNSSLFISFEGGEGSGKSTQIDLLSKTLKDRLIKFYVTREPGGSKGGEKIRKLLVKGEPQRWDSETEVLLMYAARRDNFIRSIKPKLNNGFIVISDRYSDSTRIYQGLVGGVPISKIKSIHKFSLGNFEPHLTFLLDLSVEEGLKRAKARNDKENRFESKGLDFHLSVRKSYLELASNYPNRIKIIDASGTAEEVQEKIILLIDRFKRTSFNYD